MDTKELKTLIKILRDSGITHYKTADLELTLAPESLFPNKDKTTITHDQNVIPSDNPYLNFPDGVLTEEQLMFYSSGGMPENDIHRTKDEDVQ